MKAKQILSIIRLSVAALVIAALLNPAEAVAADKDTKKPFNEAAQEFITKIKGMINKDRGAAITEYAKGARQLAKIYPEEVGPRAMMLEAANMIVDPKKQKAILAELSSLKNEKFTQIAGRAKGQLKKLEALGKPLSIKFTAIDGREVDLSKMKGKVVLIDFWATWCGPCVREIPNVIKAYEKLNKKGFEIIGISLENDKDPKKLLAYVKDKKMNWPQYHDGLYWKNKLAKEYGISSIPAMWLVDKKGNLVDMNARSGLDDKIEKLLSE